MGILAEETASNADYASDTTAATVTAKLDITDSSVSFPSSLTKNITIQLETGGIATAAPPGGLAVNLVSANTACVTPVATPVTIGAGLVTVVATLQYGGTATLPCTTTVTASGPAGVVTDNVSVTVNPTPGITGTGTIRVGAGLMESGSATLGFTLHGGVTVRVESLNPTVVQVAPNATTNGSTFVDFNLLNGEGSVSYYFHCLGGTAGQSGTIQVSAPGFLTRTHIVNCVEPLIRFIDLAASYNAFAADTLFRLQTGVNSVSGTAINVQQNLRFGGPDLVATMTTSDAGIARLKGPGGQVGASVDITIPAGSGLTPSSAVNGLSFDPVAVGTVTLSLSAPGFTTASNNATPNITITPNTITMPGLIRIGAGMMDSTTAILSATGHGGVTAHLESDNAAVLFAPNLTTTPTTTLDINVPNGSSSVSYVLHCTESAAGQAATITLTVPGFVTNTHTVNCVTPLVRFIDLAASYNTLNPDVPFRVQTGISTVGTTALNVQQSIRFGGVPLTATVTSDAPAVAQLKGPGGQVGASVTITVPVGSGLVSGLSFDPLSVGSVSVSISAPPFTTASNSSAMPITISGPTITTFAANVGAGMMDNHSASLGASAHGGVTVRVESDNANVLIAPNTSTTPASFLDVAVGNGSVNVPYVLHCLEGAAGTTATITVSSPLFTTATHSVTCRTPLVRIIDTAGSYTSFSPDVAFRVQLGISTLGGTALSVQQSLRFGSPGVTVTVTTDAPSVLQLKGPGGQVGASVTLSIPAGVGLASGLSLDPLSSGTANLSFSAPPLANASNPSALAITINTPGISPPGTLTIGAGLMAESAAFLGASAHGGVTVRVTSSNPSVALVSANTSTAGAAFVDIPVANGSTSIPFVVHGVEGAAGNTISLTFEAPGFTSASSSVNIVQPGIRVVDITSSSTFSAGAANVNFRIQIGLPNTTFTALTTQQGVRAGQSLSVTVTSSNGAVADLVVTGTTAATVNLTMGSNVGITNSGVAAGGVALDPKAPGTTTITPSASGFITVTAPTVTITP